MAPVRVLPVLLAFAVGCGAFAPADRGTSDAGLPDAPAGLDAAPDGADPGACEVYEDAFAVPPAGIDARNGTVDLDPTSSPGRSPPSLRAAMEVLANPPGSGFPTAHFDRTLA